MALKKVDVYFLYNFLFYLNWCLLILSVAPSFLHTFCLCPWVSTCMWVWGPHIPKEGIWAPAAGAAGSCELTGVNAGTSWVSVRAGSALNHYTISPAHLPYFPHIYQYFHPGLSNPYGNIFLIHMDMASIPPISPFLVLSPPSLHLVHGISLALSFPLHSQGSLYPESSLGFFLIVMEHTLQWLLGTVVQKVNPLRNHSYKNSFSRIFIQ